MSSKVLIANCPVCGYALDFLPWENNSPSSEICPCCDIQFGYEDMEHDVIKRNDIYTEYRQQWLEKKLHHPEEMKK